MQTDTDFLKNDLINFMLEVVQMDQGYSLSDLLQEKYFYESEFDDFQSLTAGLVDVRNPEAAVAARSPFSNNTLNNVLLLATRSSGPESFHVPCD